MKKCPECDSINFKIDRERGEMVCQGCGLVVEQSMIDFNKEWKDYDEGGKKSRAGAPLTPTKYDLGLRTQIGNRNDFNKIKQKGKFIRLMRWQYRSYGKERNLKFALTYLMQMSSFLKLPVFAEEEAARIYTLTLKKGLAKGRMIELMMIGALYIACKKHDLPKTLEELTEASGYDKRRILKSCKTISRALSLKYLPVSPTGFIPKFANKLKITPKTESIALDILEKAKSEGLIDGKDPVGMAASSLYIASLLNHEKRTQRKIADITGITEVTIRKRYLELTEKLNLQEKIDR